MKPADYAALTAQFHPPVVQVSGGEPLLRPDLKKIVQAIKGVNTSPYVILVTNASLLDATRYLELKKLGVDRFSISLDFPDERHDDFRKTSGLYRHLEDTLPRLADFGYQDIALNSAITRHNLPCLLALADKAEEWNVFISYSAYSTLRTGEQDHFISSKEDLETLRQTMQELIQLRKARRRILNSPTALTKTYEFFKNRGMPDCNAGRRFLVVRPDGDLNPCSMHPNRRYATQEEVLEDFSKHNRCEGCYVAIRAYTDRTFWTLLKENVASFFS